MEKKYDIIVIGSGPGGYVAAIRASQLGMKVAIVEKESLGGICLNWGCIPTKALLKSAQVFDYIQHAQDYGIHINSSSIDFNKMIQRSRNVAQDMSKGIQFLLKKNKIDVLYGEGKIKNKHTVAVYSQKKIVEYQTGHIILATGGKSRVLPNIPVDNNKIIDYRKAMSLEKQPSSIIIVGSGAIGTEFAYFYNTIGTQVTLIEYMPQLVPSEDKEIAQQLEKSFKESGMQIYTKTEVMQANIKDNECIVTIKQNENEITIKSDVVLSAVGITTNTENIGLDNLSIAKDNNRIKVNEFYQTNIDNIYAIGDIVPGPALAHVASAEGIICVEKIAGLNPEKLNYNNIPACTYSQPEIASVGYTANQAKALGYNILVGKFPFSASGKANASGKKEGFVKVVFDAQYGEWLGAQMIGENVTEMITEVVVARKLETTGQEIIKSVHPHPTMSEAVMEAVAVAYKEVIHL